MPIPIIAEAFRQGSASLKYILPVVKLLPWIGLAVVLKYFFGGARNRSERVMHGKVVMMTGGTSGIGAVIAREIATRGAQLVLLTSQAPNDLFLADYIDDLRAATGNELIYAEQVDLGSLHSIRTFATKWIDNTPPRRLDMIILCASTLKPRFAKPQQTADGVEACWGVNCLGPAHLLSILSPAIRAQPADRDVRIVFAVCSQSANRAGTLRGLQDSLSPLPKGNEFAASTLSRMVLARQFQRHLDSFTRSDKNPNNAHVVLVDPGITRTPGTRRWLTGGTLWGLALYLLFWPLAWLVLKSSEQGAQSFLFASMEAEFAVPPGGRYVRECREINVPRKDIVSDENVGSELFKFVERQITALEKQGAVERALAKKEAEAKGKNTKVLKGDKAHPNGGVLGEVREEDEDEGEISGTTTGKNERKPGSRRSRKVG